MNEQQRKTYLINKGSYKTAKFQTLWQEIKRIEARLCHPLPHANCCNWNYSKIFGCQLKPMAIAVIACPQSQKISDFP